VYEIQKKSMSILKRCWCNTGSLPPTKMVMQLLPKTVAIVRLFNTRTVSTLAVVVAVINVVEKDPSKCETQHFAYLTLRAISLNRKMRSAATVLQNFGNLTPVSGRIWTRD